MNMASTQSGEPAALIWTKPAQIDPGTADIRNVTVASNRDGDVAVGWLQEESTGYFWLRRYMKHAWDQTPLGIKDSNTMVAPNLPIGLSFARGGMLQALFVGKPTRTYWVSWNGEPSVTLDQSPRVLGDQTLGVPLAIAGDDQGRSTALWAGAPVDKKLPIFVNERVSGTWDTPKQVEVLDSETGKDTYFLEPATSSNGWFVGGVRISADTSAGPQPAELKAYIAQDANVAIIQPVTFVMPLVAWEFHIDRSGNALAGFLTLTDGHMQLLWSRCAAGERAWAAPQQLTAADVTAATFSQLPTGEAFATWFDAPDSSTKGRFFVSHYTGSEWKAPEQVSDALMREPADIKLASNTAGKVILVWAQQTQGAGASSKAIYYVQFVPSLGWSKPAVLAAYDNTISLTDLTLNEDGRAILIWRAVEAGSSIKHLFWSASQ